MQLFYTPEINPPYHILDPIESGHCVRVMRMKEGGTVFLTDGKGSLHEAVIRKADPKACEVEVVRTTNGYGKRGYGLTMAVAPTKNTDRYEWFLEKATEIGCDRFVPLICKRSERRSVKEERLGKVIAGALKQSLKAYCPELAPLTDMKSAVLSRGERVGLIAHCAEPVAGREYITDLSLKGEDVMILIGPEGDFSAGEIKFAVENGFREITLGSSRLRTETAAVAAVAEIAVINR